jgi:nanoRNase/pAp phosphatase (c-di-AMP/oligoRNAs hydrolase)
MRIITTHKNVDFDALASMMAAAVIYPEAIPVMPYSMHPNVRRFLAVHKDVFASLSIRDVDFGQVSTMVVVDTCRWDRLESDCGSLAKQEINIHLWDHHPDTGDIEANWRCHKPMGATVTLLLGEIQRQRLPITPIFSTLFLTGIYEDTGNLSFPSTKAEDALSAGFLLQKGADLSIVGDYLRPAYGKTQKAILFKMLDSSNSFAIRGLKASICKVDIDGHVTNLAVVVDMYREIINADVVFGIFTVKNNGQSVVIGRSREGISNIGSIMRALGGGGHSEAGSAMVKSTGPDQIEEIIRDGIKNYQRRNVTVADLMSFPVFSVPPDMSMYQVDQVLQERRCTGLPVIDGDRLVGIVSKRDFGKWTKDRDWQKPVKAFMRRDVVTIASGDTVEEAIRLITGNDIGRLPVLDKGRMVGIVTRTDLMRYFYDILPS